MLINKIKHKAAFINNIITYLSFILTLSIISCKNISIRDNSNLSLDSMYEEALNKYNSGKYAYAAIEFAKIEANATNADMKEQASKMKNTSMLKLENQRFQNDNQKFLQDIVNNAASKHK